ncbi:SpoIIE family protein phosphatase [Microbispora sp. CA-135349]|uniref:SpoIIE family protein phosphatase n=1 Tax=Microbispora sp. CA-135349 TaxID=3239953 RepID=UPI003D9080EE
MSGGDRILRLHPASGQSVDPGESSVEVMAGLVQAMLDAAPIQGAWVVPIRDQAGVILDFEVLAASPEARDIHNRTGKELVGLRTLEAYPGIAGSALWDAYLRVMETGEVEDVDPYVHREDGDDVPQLSTYGVHLARLQGGLLTSWVRHDRHDREERLSARLLHTERLGHLGWGHWSLITGEAEWSDQLYVIHRRDPAEGPFALEHYREIAHPDDVTVVEHALTTLTSTGGPHEFEIRIRVGDEYRHIRATAEVSRDAGGRPVEIHGVVQDVTDWRRTADELAEVTQRLEEESQLTARLQSIILPVQDAVPGLQIGVRYFPAETAPLGGDWYQAIHLDNEEALLAVGDVAGHGLAAASAMAKLRHAITGLAFADHDPAQILVALNRLLRRMRPDVLATSVVARYRTKDRTLRWTHAGHPPMLLVRGHKVHRLLHPGVLLGVFEDVTYSCAEIRLEPDDLLLMFTDGLIERPGRDLFEGLDILSAAIAETVPQVPPQDRVAAVMEALSPSNTGDDTCILVARILPNSLEVS